MAANGNAAAEEDVLQKNNQLRDIWRFADSKEP
jgi:hypothetical protein